MKNLVIKKCLQCNALVKVINDCNIMCCENPMHELEINSIDAAFEKHIPNYEIIDNKLVINVNHVMDDDHYIEWICLLTDDKEEYINLQPGQKAHAEFNNVTKGTIYSYCNKHGLWKKEI